VGFAKGCSSVRQGFRLARNAWRRFLEFGTNICQTCGLPIQSPFATNPEDEPALNFDPLCAACRLQAYRFEQARSVFRFEDALVRAVVMLKFEEFEPPADWLANRLRELAVRTGLNKADVVVSVPLHKVRRKERGFNQAEVLSKQVAKGLKLPHEAFCLTGSARDQLNIW
jgi:predicted amidophosphoribosyltransferase